MFTSVTSSSRPVGILDSICAEGGLVAPPKTFLQDLWPDKPADPDKGREAGCSEPGLLGQRLGRLEGRLAKLEANVAGRSIADAPAASVQESLASIAEDFRRLTEKVAPVTQGDIVGSRYVADSLGCSTTWISNQARIGNIPKDCIVAGTGGGKPWKFYKSRIENWLKTR